LGGRPSAIRTAFEPSQSAMSPSTPYAREPDLAGDGGDVADLGASTFELGSVGAEGKSSTPFGGAASTASRECRSAHHIAGFQAIRARPISGVRIPSMIRSSPLSTFTMTSSAPQVRSASSPVGETQGPPSRR
jgi:hypothetical protein